MRTYLRPHAAALIGFVLCGFAARGHATAPAGSGGVGTPLNPWQCSSKRPSSSYCVNQDWLNVCGDYWHARRPCPADPAAVSMAANPCCAYAYSAQSAYNLANMNG